MAFECTACSQLAEQEEILRVKGSVAERSKALVLGTSLFGGVGSNPTVPSSLELFCNQKTKTVFASIWAHFSKHLH